MLVRRRIPWRYLIAQLWPIATFTITYAIVVSGIDFSVHLEAYHIPVGVATLPGAFLGIILAFRTNSSYSRWWEARILWGKIVNDSRSLVRQLLTFTKENADLPEIQLRVKRMSYRQISWCYALAESLRGRPPLAQGEQWIDAAELDHLKDQRNIPNGLLLYQGYDLRRLLEIESIDRWQRIEIEQTLVRLTDHMGGCERIRNTPFPPIYALWVNYLVYVFIVMLPFALVDMPAIGLVLVAVPISLSLLVVEYVAKLLENPFSESLSSTPVLTLSRSIEIDLRNMLGESDTPPEMLPEDGVLY